MRINGTFAYPASSVFPSRAAAYTFTEASFQLTEDGMFEVCLELPALLHQNAVFRWAPPSRLGCYACLLISTTLGPVEEAARSRAAASHFGGFCDSWTVAMAGDVAGNISQRHSLLTDADWLAILFFTLYLFKGEGSFYSTEACLATANLVLSHAPLRVVQQLVVLLLQREEEAKHAHATKTDRDAVMLSPPVYFEALEAQSAAAVLPDSTHIYKRARMDMEGSVVPLVSEAVPLVCDAIPLVCDAIPLVCEAVPLVCDAIPLVCEAVPLVCEAVLPAVPLALSDAITKNFGFGIDLRSIPGFESLVKNVRRWSAALHARALSDARALLAQSASRGASFMTHIGLRLSSLREADEAAAAAVTLPVHILRLIVDKLLAEDERCPITQTPFRQVSCAWVSAKCFHAVAQDPATFSGAFKNTCGLRCGPSAFTRIAIDRENDTEVEFVPNKPKEARI